MEDYSGEGRVQEKVVYTITATGQGKYFWSEGKIYMCILCNIMFK